MGNACTEGLAILVDPSQYKVVRPQKFLTLGSIGAICNTHTSFGTNTNTKLLETYAISDVIGEGAFGTVRKSTSRKTGGTCALKSIEKRGPPEEREVLANEIAIHAACDNPNIVRIYETFEDPAWIHIAMEACEGGDLYGLMTEVGSLGELDAGLVMQQVLRAVYYLHEVKCVVHRDLKLENLLLKYRGVPLEQNVVKVIDFGFAGSFVPGERSLTTVCGTAEYMAPEVISGPYDEKVDIWSCGVLLYELLSGACPFYSDTAYEIQRLAKTYPLPMEGKFWDEMPFDVKEAIEQLCFKDPSMRPSAEEALQSPWFQRLEPASPLSSTSSGSLTSSVAENLRAFSSCSDLQKLALRVAVRHLDDPKLEEPRTAFRLLDKNGDGRLTPEEVCDGCSELGLEPEEATEIFQHLDADGNGAIEYSEFLGAAISKDSLTEHACWEAFRYCDRDNTGSISAKNVEELLQPAPLGVLRRIGVRGLGLSRRRFQDLDFDTFACMLRCPSGAGAECALN